MVFDTKQTHMVPSVCISVKPLPFTGVVAGGGRDSFKLQKSAEVYCGRVFSKLQQRVTQGFPCNNRCIIPFCNQLSLEFDFCGAEVFNPLETIALKR